MHRLQFVPECFAETTMVKELFLDLGYINHASGISQVNTILKKEDIGNYINIGFVDNDKKNGGDCYFHHFLNLRKQLYSHLRLWIFYLGS